MVMVQLVSREYVQQPQEASLLHLTALVEPDADHITDFCKTPDEIQQNGVYNMYMDLS